jgi:hypothetical protein
MNDNLATMPKARRKRRKQLQSWCGAQLQSWCGAMRDKRQQFQGSKSNVIGAQYSRNARRLRHVRCEASAMSKSVGYLSTMN